MSHERERLNFPSLSVEDAVLLTNSMFGNKMVLTEDDIKRPQVKNLLKTVEYRTLCFHYFFKFMQF